MIIDGKGRKIVDRTTWGSVTQLDRTRRRRDGSTYTHWRVGRSAMTAAECWLSVTAPDLPFGIAPVLSSHSAFGIVTGWTATTEVELAFDEYAKGRMTDVLVAADDEHGPLLLAVECKVDESFGQTVKSAIRSAFDARLKYPESRALDRVIALVRELFGMPEPPRVHDVEALVTWLGDLGRLRYQLLTATAGAVCEAQRRTAATGIPHRVVLLVQEFLTTEAPPKDSDSIHKAMKRNTVDLERFVSALSQGRVSTCRTGTMCGPLELPSAAPFGAPMPAFWIAKVQEDRRLT